MEELGGNPKGQLEKLFDASLRLTLPSEAGVEPLVIASQKKQIGDYHCNNARRLYPKKSCDAVAHGQALVHNLPTSEMVQSCVVVDRGSISVVLSSEWIAKGIESMLTNGIDSWAPTLPVKTAVVDFCSLNIAKEMNLCHGRSTIIGDSLARMLEYSKVQVLRRNHVGDWGTNFGMLIEYLFELFPGSDVTSVATIADLQSLYRHSKAKFYSDPLFRKKAQLATVRLQRGDPAYVKHWAQICETSRTESAKVIKLLQVELEEKGESFYKPYIAKMIEELKSKGLAKESDGALVIFSKGFMIPLMLVKSDGGFTYDTTDMAALWYRLNEEKAEWIIYVTDVGQQRHFDMLFEAARKADWLPSDVKTYPRASHASFGKVHEGGDKPFRSRFTESVPLAALLHEAKGLSKTALIERGYDKEMTVEELDQTAEAVGCGALKYADLKNKRLSSYTFSFDQILCDKGDTAVYLLKVYSRICSIIRKCGKDIDELKQTGKLVLYHAEERALGLHLLQFAEAVEEACTKLLPNVVCKYLYKLSKQYSKFYNNCQVIGSAEETSRLLLCEATAIVMRKCFHLLGITPVDKL